MSLLTLYNRKIYVLKYIYLLELMINKIHINNNQQDSMMRIKANRIFDGMKLHEKDDFIIDFEKNGNILYFGPEIGYENNIDEEIDVRHLDVTILPGLIDAHVHPALRAEDSYQTSAMMMSGGEKTLLAYKNLSGILKAGFTTIRCAGDPGLNCFPTFDCRWGEKMLGLGPLPRICGAGHYISITGGGGDVRFSPESYTHCRSSNLIDGLIADGADDILKAIRHEIKYGSNWIKILVSGAFMSVDDSPMHSHMSMNEINCSVEEARRRDVCVMAHAHSPESILFAVRAGARSIEHASFIDDNCIDEIITNNKEVWIIPTLLVGDYFSLSSTDGPLSKMVHLLKTTKGS